jgi:hypothetical protein
MACTSIKFGAGNGNRTRILCLEGRHNKPLYYTRLILLPFDYAQDTRPLMKIIIYLAEGHERSPAKLGEVEWSG